MKLKYTSIILALALVSMVSLFLLIPSASTFEINRDFQFETLYGDPAVADEIALTRMIRTAPNQFAEVRWSAGTFSIEETIFDQRHQLSGRQLENRELYRGMTWAHEAENNEIFARVHFDDSYFWRNNDPEMIIAVLDKKTGDVRRETIAMPEIPQFTQFWSSGFTIGSGGSGYLLVRGERQFMVFSVDFDNMTSELILDYSFAQNLWIEPILSGDYLYLVDQTNPSENSVDKPTTRINLSTLAEDEVIMPHFIWSLNSAQHSASNLEGNILYFDMENRTWIFDTETNEAIMLPQSEFTTTDNTNWVNASSVLMTDHHLAVTYTISSQNTSMSHIIVMYNRQTLAIEFIGSQPTRRDHGFVNQWGGFRLERAE
jgi:hypothetical protein